MLIDLNIDVKKILKQAIKEEGIKKVLEDIFEDMPDSDYNDALEWLEESYNLTPE